MDITTDAPLWVELPDVTPTETSTKLQDDPFADAGFITAFSLIDVQQQLVATSFPRFADPLCY